MAGEVWEVRPQPSEQRPRTLLGGKKGSITWREERRPLLLPGDVRQLARDEQLVFVSGANPENKEGNRKLYCKSAHLCTKQRLLELDSILS